MAFINIVNTLGVSSEHVGDGVLAGESPGLVTVAGAPASRRVHVRNKRNHEIVAIVASASDGTWSVRNLDQSQKFYVIAFDHTEQFNAVIRDNVTPAPMP